MKLMLAISAILIGMTARAAEVIELPPEELAQESVLPVFENAPMVKNRAIVTAQKIEADVFYGMALTEPIANVSKIGLGVYYHLNEDHVLGLVYTKNSTGLSDYAKQLNAKYTLDFSRVPYPVSTLLLDYNYQAFYGKMSITKETVVHLSLFGSAAIGQVQYIHKSYPAVALGIGQKFYFTKQLSLRMDLRIYAHQAPIPFVAGDPGIRSGTEVPSYSDFSERMTYTNNMETGLSYIF
jgi:outer membrane beta-barrel protein